jgi:hypothetical protein
VIRDTDTLRAIADLIDASPPDQREGLWSALARGLTRARPEGGRTEKPPVQ